MYKPNKLDEKDLKCQRHNNVSDIESNNKIKLNIYIPNW